MAPLIRLRTFLENLSLRKTIALALIIGLAVPVGVSTFITLTQSRAALMERLRSDHARIVDVLASGLQTPLWEMRPDAGRPLLEVLMLDNRVTAISISSPLMPQFLAIEAPKPPLGEVLSLERPVLRDGEEIGRIRVDMDTGPMKTRLAAQWIPILLTGLLQFGTGIVIIFALLRYKVITPLQRLVNQSESLAAGDLDQSLEWRRHDEPGALGRSFDKMRRSLRRLVADLEERNQELQAREAALASQTAVLRAILDNMTDGITLVDKDLDLVAWNDRFIDIMAVSPELIRPGLSIQELSKVDLARSDYEPCDREATLKALRESFQPGRSITIPYRMADGRQIAIRRRPMPGGGFVSTYTDVTEQVEARRKADETRLLLEAVMDAVPAMLHVKDRRLRYQMANRRFLECWGFEREQFLGRSSHELFPESMSRAVEARDRQVLETSKPLPFTEITYKSPMGTMIVWSTKVPLIDADGKVTHIVTVDLDISERKRAEQERQRWAQLLHDAIESIPNGFAVYDASQRLVICNNAFASLYGTTTEALVGARFAELAPQFLEQVLTLDGRSSLEEGQQAYPVDRYWEVTAEPVEVQLKDGRWFLISRHPTAEGGIVFVRTDITHLKRMEQQLRESEQRFRTIAETHPVPSVIISRQDQRLLYASPGFAGLCGAPLADILHLSPDSLYGDLSDRQRLLEELATTGSVESYEMPLKRPDGVIIPVSVSAKLITYQGEDAILASILDLTEQKRAHAELARHREALHQTEKLSALGSLLAGVAHELNNPLSVVVGRTIMLEEQLRGSEVARSLAKVRAAAERCARIVKTFLAMARRQELARVPIQLRQVIDASLELVSYGLRASEVEVTVDLEPDLPEITADPDQLIQVFTNLFVNAEQAMAKTSGPRLLAISARCDRDANALRIRVSDTGPGIPKEIVPRIFEPFFTTKPVGEGTGFGLSISRGLIEAHGGTITVELPAAGGTVFEITLPLGAPGRDKEVEIIAAAGETAARRILVVDDVPEIAQMLADILDEEGYRIETAESGRAALKCLERQPFDLIISDLRMPDLDGPGLYAKLRAHQPQLLERLLFITGDTLSPSIKRFLSEADRPVIEKPFVPAEIRRAVAQVLDQVDQAQS